MDIVIPRINKIYKANSQEIKALKTIQILQKKTVKKKLNKKQMTN